MKFALITEGISEHRILKHLITKFFKDQEPLINQIQPKLNQQKQDGTGGWREVLKYCERDEIRDILIENDYLVIQIDTDMSSISPYSIEHTKPNGAHKTQEELYEEVLQKLQSLIQQPIWKTYHNRIFFAISIHILECWLLPMVNTKYEQTNNCLPLLNQELRKKKQQTISAKNSSQSIKAYDNVLRNANRRKEILAYAKYHYSFGRFVQDLERIPVPSSATE